MDRRAFTLIVALFAIAGFGMVLVDDQPDDAANEAVTALHGYVYDVPAQQDRTVIAGVAIVTWISPGTVFETVYSQEDGSFLLSYNPDVKYVTFELAGYTVKGWSSELKKYGDTGMYSIQLKDGSNVGGVHELYDDSGYTALISRTDAAIHGSVSTLVGTEETPVANAMVKLKSGKTTLTATTDADGYFEFYCATGVTYSITVQCGGFKDVEIPAVIPSEETVKINLIQKTHELVLGMDVAHTMALFGILIMIILILGVIILIKRPEKEDGLYLVNDLEPKKPKKKKDDQ